MISRVSLAAMAFLTTLTAYAQHAPREGAIQLISATYGGSCGVRAGNASMHVSENCDRLAACSYWVLPSKLGDPAFGCEKNFLVNWRCTDSGLEHFAHVSRPAEAKRIAMGCRAGPGDIVVKSATYGGNCQVPSGNATSFVARACDGLEVCAFKVEQSVVGDPAPFCFKEFHVRYECQDSGTEYEASLESSADTQTAVLSCDR